MLQLYRKNTELPIGIYPQILWMYLPKRKEAK